jgi:hypothetical protein
MHIDREKQSGRFTAAGELMPAEVGSLATSAVEVAGAERLRTLIVDFARTSMPRALTVTECYQLGERLAQAGAGLRKVAFLTPAHCIDLHAFIFTVAANRGLAAAAFTGEAEALRWLSA